MCGPSKPKGLEFLDETVQEILQDGFTDDNTFTVNVKCIISDAPAKAFVKAVQLCSGYYGGDKCT